MMIWACQRARQLSLNIGRTSCWSRTAGPGWRRAADYTGYVGASRSRETVLVTTVLPSIAADLAVRLGTKSPARSAPDDFVLRLSYDNPFNLSAGTKLLENLDVTLNVLNLLNPSGSSFGYAYVNDEARFVPPSASGGPRYG